MKVVDTIEAYRHARTELPGSVGFVPTMGALHAGHRSLMEEALKITDHLVVSIFVNPTQFGPDEDFGEYPRDRQGDLERCEEMGADIVFLPRPDVMYENGEDQPTFVRVRRLTEGLCGAGRPGHFQGVTTVVTKLFNIVRPDVAVFGQKDYQQLAVIRQMTRDLNFPVQIVSGPTQREADGLAISSRNLNLEPEHRLQAPALSQGLGLAWRRFEDGQRDAAALEGVTRERIEREEDARIDYVTCVHPVTLRPLAGEEIGEDGAVIAVAVFFGDVRLIDNVRLDEPLPEEIAIED